MPVLVDSSLWVHQLRRSGEAAKRGRVNSLLLAGDAAWCPVVRLELWRGVASDGERRTLRQYEARLPDFSITAAVWDLAMELASSGRRSGLTVPIADLLIFACAIVHELDLAHDDAHFDQIAALER
jgi:predicted nucleic acid-binding protein